MFYCESSHNFKIHILPGSLESRQLEIRGLQRDGEEKDRRIRTQQEQIDKYKGV